MAALERRLQLAGKLLISGLLVEAVCLLWSRPFAFLLLVGLGGFLCAAGIFVYLYSLVAARDLDPKP
jgi:hypothetical protein